MKDWNGRAILQDLGNYDAAIKYAEKIVRRCEMNGNIKMADEYRDAVINLKSRQIVPIHYTKSGSF